MWFHCRQKPSDTARSVLWRAKSLMAVELHNLQHVYIKALARYKLVEQQVKHLYPCCNDSNREDLVMKALCNMNPIQAAKIRPEDFVTGLVRLNRMTQNMSGLSREERRKILFGSDQIVP
ncbi:unnamed protein product [Heterosigma akashiwo]